MSLINPQQLTGNFTTHFYDLVHSDADLHQVEHEVLEAVRRGRVTCLAEVGCKDEVLGANLLCYRGGFLDFHLLILRRIAANIAKLPELLRKP